MKSTMKTFGARDEAIELVAALGRDFASTLDIERTLGGALRRIADHVGAEAGALVLDGVPIDLGRIRVPAYVLATREDHIAP